MIDQNILYAECPCGSGKKFKFCCYPEVRGELPKDPTLSDVTMAIRRRSQSARLAEHVNDTGFVDLERFHGMIRRGLGYLNEGRYGDAKQAFLVAKDEFDMLPTPYNNLALCALVQGDLKEAEEWTQEVIRRFPVENPFGMALQADIRYLKGDLLGARDIIARAEQIEPPTVDQALRLCESMAHFMEHERILRYAEKSGFADDPEMALFCGIALANQGRAREAERALRIAVRGRQGAYARRILDGVTAEKRAPTICGDWMYFTPESFTLFAGLMKDVRAGGEQQAGLSSEVIAECIEVEANGGLIAPADVIKILAAVPCKRTERILNALRSDDSRPTAVRKAASKAYDRLFVGNELGECLRNASAGGIQQMVITEEAATHAPLDPAYEESYFKAVRICMNPKSRKGSLKEALRLLEDLHAKVPGNPAVTNNYASALSRLGRFDEAIEVLRDCFAQHPEYVFGAANYLGSLIYAEKLEEAEAMIANYRLPQRIHPEAYRAWCRVEMRYYALTGDQERFENVQKSLDLVAKEFGQRPVR